MNIPTEADWRSEPWDLDSAYAYDHFFGKDLEEAFDVFVNNVLYYQEDLMFMPLSCFSYYVMAYSDYLLSEASKDDSDGANGFFGLVEIRNNDISQSGDAVIKQIRKTLTRLRDNQFWYDADEEIYGCFKTRGESCLKLIQAEQGRTPNN